MVRPVAPPSPLLNRTKPEFWPDESPRRLLAVAAGLQHIHTHFGVHGSLRPVNCLVKEDGTTCVGDYGFGKIKELTGGGARISNTPGLYSYTAPEMLRSVRPLPSPLPPSALQHPVESYLPPLDPRASQFSAFVLFNFVRARN